MQIKKIMNKKQREEINTMLISNYQSSFDLKDYHMYTMQDDKLWIVSKTIDIKNIVDLKRCYRIGIYFGKLKRNNKIKLTIEGAILIARTAKRNIVIIDEETALTYTQGNIITNYTAIDADINNYVLVKCGNDCIGCGLLRDNHIENLISKARRLVKVKNAQ